MTGEWSVSHGRKSAAERVLRELQLVRRREPAMDVLLSLVERRHAAWAVVGGAPRVWMLGYPTPPRDLDITVSGTASGLEETVRLWIDTVGAQEYGRTSFGGYQLRVGKGSVDMWSAERTIGIERERVSDAKVFRAVAKSAALSFDSCVVTSNGVMYERGFFKSWHTGVLALNHWEPEREEDVARKAVWLCQVYKLIPDMRVQLLIQGSLGSEHLESSKVKINEGPVKNGAEGL